MAHHTYNTHMLRHVEAWAKPTSSGTVEMIATAGTSCTTTVTMGTPSTSSPVTGTTTVQWPSAASELCEVVITECLRQQQQLAQQHTPTIVTAQQATGTPTTISTTASTIAISPDHEVPTIGSAHLAMDEVLRTDMTNIHGHTILPGTTTVAVPVHVVTSSSGSKSRKCSHHHRHHYHHHHGHHSSQQHVHHPHILHQDKLTAMGYNVAPYPCRYRLPSSDLLPNHDELVAAGAIPANTQTMVLPTLPQPAPPPPPAAPTTTKQRKPRGKGSRGGRGGKNKQVGTPPDSLPAPAPTPVVSTSTFPCPECGKKFLWASRLVVHRRSHTGEKPFACTQCGSAFAQRWILAVHMKTHNPPDPQDQMDNGHPSNMVAPRSSQQNINMQGQQVEI